HGRAAHRARHRRAEHVELRSTARQGSHSQRAPLARAGDLRGDAAAIVGSRREGAPALEGRDAAAELPARETEPAVTTDVRNPLDASGMGALIEGAPAQVLQAIRQPAWPAFERSPDLLAVGAMGGSAIAADLTASLFR